ncbi:hypothetical protein HY968_03295 [Candidatus Kaiserbacteria bacterium]|nr:hypothetical protein [Candidatus Kaiserbacteria bacterium]
MGAVRSPFKRKAIALRLQGRSYNDILRMLKLTSKGTLSFWLKGLTLSPEAKKETTRKFGDRFETKLAKIQPSTFKANKK